MRAAPVQAAGDRRLGLLRLGALTLAGLGAVLLEAAPAGIAPLSLPSPDLLFCLVAVWAVRAPEAAPILLVFALGLVRDFLTDLPPGLGALSLVAAGEALKARAGALARQPFAVEWLWVAAGGDRHAGAAMDGLAGQLSAAALCHAAGPAGRGDRGGLSGGGASGGPAAARPDTGRARA